MSGSSQVVFFGIQSALRLAQAARQAFVESTAERRLVLPLPQGLTSPLIDAKTHARSVRERDPQRYAERFAKHDRATTSSVALKRREAAGALIELFLSDLATGNTETGPDPDLVGLFAVRQWQSGDEIFPSPLQRVGGALTEIAVDYFLGVPGALDADSKQGKTLQTFLAALDDTDFQEASGERLLVDLFRAAVQTAAQHPELFSEREKEQELVGSILEGVVDEAAAQLARIRKNHPGGDFDRENELTLFATLVTRSALRNAGRELLDNPGVLDTDEGDRGAVAKRAGATLLKLLFDETDEDGGYSFSDALRRTASRSGFEQLTRVTIKAATEHPGVFGVKENAIETWIVEVLSDLHSGHEEGDPFFDSDLFAEVAFLAIDHGLEDLPALLDVRDDQMPAIVSVGRYLFETVATKDGAGVRWDFDLSRNEVRGLFDLVFAAAAAHPQWFTGDPEAQELVALSLALVTDGLGQLEGAVLKLLVKSGRFEPLLSAVLSSGIGDRLGEVEPERVNKIIAGAAALVQADGIAGLVRLLEDGVVTDVLAAIGDDAVWGRLFGDDEEDAQRVLETVVELLRSRRSGGFQSIAEMTAAILQEG